MASAYHLRCAAAACGVPRDALQEGAHQLPRMHLKAQRLTRSMPSAAAWLDASACPLSPPVHVEVQSCAGEKVSSLRLSHNFSRRPQLKTAKQAANR